MVVQPDPGQGQESIPGWSLWQRSLVPKPGQVQSAQRNL